MLEINMILLKIKQIELDFGSQQMVKVCVLFIKIHYVHLDVIDKH